MALTRAGFVLRRFSRKLWVRSAGFAVLGGVAAVAGRVIGPWVPPDLFFKSGGGSVGGLLNILASSMLAVTTFSLSIMVSAYSAAAAAVTPRAVNLLLEDRTSQTVLSTFLGAFLFALVGLIALEAGIYGDGGRVVLFAATIAVTAAVVLAMLRWISHLTTFGRVGDTTRRVEEAALAALRSRLDSPCLGGMAMPAHGPPKGFVPVLARDTGYLCHIDMPQLDEVAKTIATSAASKDTPDLAGPPLLYVGPLPGCLVHTKVPLVWIAPQHLTDDIARDLQAAFTIRATRNFDQDPRFGLCVLSEIAERALSPAVNDPGTAIDVLSRALRVLSHWPERATSTPQFPLVAVPDLHIEDAFADIFPAIARDGAAIFAVQVRLQKTLLALATLSPGLLAQAAATQSSRAMAEARAKLTHPEEADLLQALSDQIAALARTTDHQTRTI